MAVFSTGAPSGKVATFRLFISLLIVAWILPAAAEVEIKHTLPDKAEGVIGGEAAVLIWPYEYDQQVTLPSDDCTVVLEPHDGTRFQYLNYPCGQWLTPPLGKYDAWVILPEYTSPSAAVFHYAGRTPSGEGSIMLFPVVRRATLVIRGKEVPHGANVRVFGKIEGTSITYERQFPPASQLELPVPVGVLMVGVFDDAGKIMYLSTPTRIKALDIQRVSLPTAAQSVVLIVEGRAAEKYEPILHLGKSGSRRADHQLVGVEKSVFVWEDIPAGEYSMSLSGVTGTYKLGRVRKSNGNAATVRQLVPAELAAPRDTSKPEVDGVDDSSCGNH